MPDKDSNSSRKLFSVFLQESRWWVATRLPVSAPLAFVYNSWTDAWLKSHPNFFDIGSRHVGYDILIFMAAALLLYPPRDISLRYFSDSGYKPRPPLRVLDVFSHFVNYGIPVGVLLVAALVYFSPSGSLPDDIFSPIHAMIWILGISVGTGSRNIGVLTLPDKKYAFWAKRAKQRHKTALRFFAVYIALFALFLMTR